MQCTFPIPSPVGYPYLQSNVGLGLPGSRVVWSLGHLLYGPHLVSVPVPVLGNVGWRGAHLTQDRCCVNHEVKCQLLVERWWKPVARAAGRLLKCGLPVTGTSPSSSSSSCTSADVSRPPKPRAPCLGPPCSSWCPVAYTTGE